MIQIALHQLGTLLEFEVREDLPDGSYSLSYFPARVIGHSVLFDVGAVRAAQLPAQQSCAPGEAEYYRDRFADLVERWAAQGRAA